MSKIRILSIDGGGIRGILPATVLVYLENLLRDKTKNESFKLGDAFDLIAGTSTGGILSCIYLAPGNTDRGAYSANEALDLYLKHGGEIFHRKAWKKVESMGGVWDEKYSHENLYGLLTEYLGDTHLSEAQKPSLITAYDITDRRAVFFTSADARKYEGSNFLLRDVARATAAAPTYFEPAHIKSLDGKNWALVDGGVFANNPALCAYSEALGTDFTPFGRTNPAGAKDMLILSLGTGSVKKQYHYEHFERAGQLKWLEPIIDILMSGNSETVDYELKKIYGTLTPENREDYYRLEFDLLEACSEMDEATDKNITRLHDAGLSFIGKNRPLLDAIAEKILKYS